MCFLHFFRNLAINLCEIGVITLVILGDNLQLVEQLHLHLQIASDNAHPTAARVADIRSISGL